MHELYITLKDHKDPSADLSRLRVVNGFARRLEMEQAVERMNILFAQGFAVCLTLRGSCYKAQIIEEPLPGDVVVRVACGLDIWKSLAKQFGVSLANTAVLISPTGKVLAASSEESVILGACERLEYILVKTVGGEEQELAEQHQIKRQSADEWVDGLKNKDQSAFKILKEVTTVPPSKTPRESGRADMDSETDTKPLSLDRKRTKLAVRFTDARPRVVVEVDDIHTYKLRDLLAQLNEPEIQSISCDYPRRKFDNIIDLEKTMFELGLDSNPSLTATVAGATIRGPRPAQGNGQNAATLLHTWILGFLSLVLESLTRLYHFLIQLIPQRAVPQRHLRDTAPASDRVPDQRKTNQYWNGDSTVFEGPNDEDKKEN